MLKALKQALDDFKGALGSGPRPPAGSRSEPVSLPDAPPFPSAEPPDQEAAAAEIPESTGSAGDAESPAEQLTGPGMATEAGGSAGSDGGAFSGRNVLVLAAVVLVGWLAWQNLDSWLWPEPADKGVVATYSGGTVTREQLVASLESHPAADRRALATPEGLRQLVEDIAIHRVVEQWAKERQLDEKSNVQHAMKHAAEDVNIHDLTNQVHEGQIRVDESEIQGYYEENREQLGNRPLADVREAIRQTLHAGKEKQYVEGYMSELWARASVTVDYQLLAVPEVTEDDLSYYYTSRQAEFRQPEQLRLQEMRFEVSSGDKDREARERADKALARIQAGEDFAQVAQSLGGGPIEPGSQSGSAYVAKGTRGAEFDEKVFSLREGEVSQVLKDPAGYSVVKVLERRREGTRSLDEAREAIRTNVEQEKTAQAYKENRAKTLFTMRGRRFTLGEFLEELDQFPPDLQAQYRDFESKKRLVDGLIDRLLVLDTASSQLLDVKNKEEMDDARRHVLAQILHQEEVQDKLTVSDDEVKKSYEQHRQHYAQPARVKVSYIRVGMGGTEDSRKRARERIDEAARRLQAAKDRPEAFTEVAREFSEDPETADRGGDLDQWLAQTDDVLSHSLAHDFTEAVFRLKVGETSPVVALGDSYYVVRVREREESKSLSFEEVKGIAKQDLQAEKHERAMRNMEEELARRMGLVVYDGRLQSLVAEVKQSATSDQPSVVSGQQPGGGSQQPAVGTPEPAVTEQRPQVGNQGSDEHASHR